jgi:hypothetical protein
MTRWVWCVALSLSVLFQVRYVRALPSQRCETIELVDHEGMSQQLGLPKLVELLKTIPLRIVPNGVPADIRIDFTFSSGSSRIRAAIHSWAETESIELQSERVRWLEDFQARRRTVQPMQEADAEAFRQQIVAELTKQVEARTAAVVIASEPEGLPVVTTVPDNQAPPLNRNRTVAMLGCLRDGAELEGYVAWPDGHRVQFKRRANLAPGRFVVGSPASTERPPVPESPSSTDASAPDPEPSIAREKPARSRSWYWWLGGPLMVILALMARALIKKR